MTRYRERRPRVILRPAPSILHTVKKDVELPIEGCRCDECEDARAELETSRITHAMGEPAESEGR